MMHQSAAGAALPVVRLIAKGPIFGTDEDAYAEFKRTVASSPFVTGLILRY